MRREFLACLACPTCGADLAISEIAKEDSYGIDTGTLSCTACGRAFPITKHVPRFVPMENYASGFGFQWNIHSRTQHDRHNGTTISETRFFKETKWPRQMGGEYLLEVGCGAGRFTGHAASTGAFVVSMDYSSAVDANFANNGHLSNLLIVQADIYQMPLRRSFFDKVFCLGVLQHTPNVEESFKCLAMPLKPGGRLAIDVYDKPKGRQRLLATKYHVRALTKRLPSTFLYRVCKGYISLMWPVARLVRRLPRGRRLNWILLIPDYAGVFNLSDDQLKEWAILDLFDMLAPAYDSPQYLETIQRWFAEIGMRDVEVHFGQNGIEGRGVKPVTAIGAALPLGALGA
jgi:SAM-dependent methyltransferase